MLEIENITVTLGQRTAVDGASLRVEPGEVMAVMGPSGSGKTTLLRTVGGLERPDRGTVRWAGQDLTGVPPHRRHFGFMFQDLALFPHLDVAANVGFGVADENGEVDQALALVGLAGSNRRRVQSLSGGEQQRVALARSLATLPRLLMLDEPLGSLDRPLRDDLVRELREIFAAAGLPVLYVTHDRDEAFAIGHRVAVMNHGRIIQTGTPAELWAKPQSEFVARFLGFNNIVDATLDDGMATTPWGPLPTTAAGMGQVRLVVRPDAWTLGSGGVTGVVARVTFRGDHLVVEITPNAGPTIEAWLREEVAVGDHVSLVADPAGVLFLG
ncbi:MAG: ABC transporter ATP-binding protein [Acidimicrobiia bacterium]|nr:ABC transporter ATP-binding protein [Acidimicrobiia bacterium]